MRALITGSNGFIGSHIARYLDDRHCQVLELDTKRPEMPIDCRDFFRESNLHIDLVFHCAAVIPDIDERAKNAMPVAGNLELDSAMFQWAMRTRPGKIVYFSSSAAYPAHLHHWDHRLAEEDIDLDDLHEPNGVYGFVKLAGELQAREARRQGLDVLVVRPQTVYGADQSLNYPFPQFVARAKRRDDPFEVWGSGSQARDFIHVDDAVRILMAMVEDGEQGPVNIGTGHATTMTELAVRTTTIAGYSPVIELHPERPDGAPVLHADVDRMCSYGAPTITLSEGIERALAE